MTDDVCKTALIALGANLAATPAGNAATLERALAALAARLGPVRRSRFWRSPAWPPGSGPEFVNACAAVRVALRPEAVLEVLHAIEAELGRERRRRWGPRVVDLDLLGMDDAVLPSAAEVARWMALAPADQARLAPEELIVPHPRLHERAFVLWPLAEVAPQWRHPVLGLSVAEMTAALPPGAGAGMAML
jgi:2-amino-4-hydroxy-6-hydroxymethyldihydropteridine diphosphokinase